MSTVSCKDFLFPISVQVNKDGARFCEILNVQVRKGQDLAAFGALIARQIGKEFHLTESNQVEVEMQVMEQMKTMCIGYHCRQHESNIIHVKVNATVGACKFVETFEWDTSESQTAIELFAWTTCSDQGLPNEFVGIIREEIYRQTSEASPPDATVGRRSSTIQDGYVPGSLDPVIQAQPADKRTWQFNLNLNASTIGLSEDDVPRHETVAHTNQSGFPKRGTAQVLTINNDDELKSEQNVDLFGLGDYEVGMSTLS